MTLYVWIVLLCGILAPGRDVEAFARATALAVGDSAPLFRDDEGKQKTCALMVAVGFRESGFRSDAIGDGGRAIGPWQLWSVDRSTDVNGQARIALDRLRESMRVCGPSNLLGLYASGRCDRGHRISVDRLWLAKDTARRASAL